MNKRLYIFCFFISLVFGHLVHGQDPLQELQQSTQSQVLYKAFEDADESDKEHVLCDYVFFRLAHNLEALSKALPGIDHINKFFEKMHLDMDLVVRLVDHQQFGRTVVDNKTGSISLEFGRELFLHKHHLKAYIQFIIEHEIIHVIQNLCGFAYQINNNPISNHCSTSVKKAIPLYFAHKFPTHSFSSAGPQRYLNMLELEADAFALLFHPDKKGLYAYLQKRKTRNSRPPCYLQTSTQKEWLEFLFAHAPYTEIEYRSLLERCALLICTMHMDGYIPVNWQKIRNTPLTESNKNNIRSIVETLLQESLYEKFFYAIQDIPKHYELVATHHISMGTDNEWGISFDQEQKICSISCGQDIREGLTPIKKAISEFVDCYAAGKAAVNLAEFNPINALTSKLFRETNRMEKV